MPRIDDVQQQFQQAIEDLQARINQAEWFSAQEKSLEQLKEIVTGLSVQMLQATNRPGDGGNNGGNNYSRLAHIDFPKFEGDDVQGWLYKCEQFFEIDAIVGSRRVKVTSIHLMGRALIWHQAYMRDFGPGNWPRWDDYKAAIVGRFGTGPFDDLLAKLMKLKQNGSAAVYQKNLICY